MNLNVGDTLFYARYRIERVLGQGGFGITYLCEQTGLGRKVAIKEFFMHEYCERDRETASITLGSSGSREMVERFRQKFIKEARALAALNHKHIVRIIDIFEENNTAYYVMEYVGGGSLSDKVKAGALSEAAAVRYIRQIASALDFVHGKHMMHLDVKPSNILLNENDEAVLIDFGLAKQYDTQGSQTSTTPVGISHGYAPLEQYKQGGVGTFSPATDIYSLGATLYKLLTGQTPPEAGDVMNDGLPELPVGISDNVRKAVETAMQPAVRKRPQSVGEFLALLDKKVKAENGKVETESNDDGATVVGGSVMNNEILRSAQDDKEQKPVVSSERSNGEISSTDAGETVLLTNDKLSPSLRGMSNDVAEGVEECKGLHADAGATVVENSSTPGGEIPGGCVISSESEKSLENGENEILHSTQDNKERAASTDDGETVFNVVIPNVREESPKKRHFSKRLITIISVAAICIIVAIFGIKSCNDRKTAEAEAQRATAIAEQQRIDAERKAQERADSIATEQQRQEQERLAKEAAEKAEEERIAKETAEKKRKEEEERKRKEEEYARTHGKINGHEYVDLGLSVKWATCNVGASVPEEYGGYYAWGETEEKSNYDWSTYKWCNGSFYTMTKYCTNSSYGTVDNKTVLDPKDDVAHVKWGGTWRMPTKAEQDELRKNCTWTWTTQNGVEGYKVTSKKNANSIFLPAAGSRDGTDLYDSGSYYLSSSLYEGYGYSACYLYFNSGYYGWKHSDRYKGLSVRPVSK